MRKPASMIASAALLLTIVFVLASREAPVLGQGESDRIRRGSE